MPDVITKLAMGTIVARRPRTSLVFEDSEYILVDRGAGTFMRWVSATATPDSLAGGEWIWGHYFQMEADARAHYHNR